MHNVAYQPVKRSLQYHEGSVSYISGQIRDSAVYEYDSLIPSFIWLFRTPYFSIP